MRFQQLKKNSNNILKKKLIKSKKRWITITILSIVGGFISIFSTMDAKADVISDQSSTNESVKTNLSSEASISNDNTSSNKPNTKPTNQAPNLSPQTDTQATNNQSLSTQYIQNQQVQANTPTINSTSDNLNKTNNLVVPSGMDGNITEQGQDGTSNYFITDKGTLYLTGGILDKTQTQNLGLKHRNDVYSIDTTLAKPNSVFAPNDSSSLFAGSIDNESSSPWFQTKTMKLANLNTSNVTNMSKMFFYLYNTNSIDLSNFNTSKVTDMSNMFSDSWMLRSLDCSSFDTSNVTDMSGMFEDYGGSDQPIISNFVTHKLTNMTSMFGDSRITSLDLSNFDTSKVKEMGAIFGDMNFLRTLNLSNFDTRSAIVNDQTDPIAMSRIFMGVALSKITLGPNAKFHSPVSGCPSFYTGDGRVASNWVNITDGKKGTLKFQEEKLVDDYHPTQD